jgi:AraC-like DNA-binding protein
MSPLENTFRTKAENAVKLNIDKEYYSIVEFASDLSMSRSNLSKKMREITGLSPNEFIVNTKLKIALTLLAEGRLSVKEVAYKIGFNDPKYFSRRFKKEFGTSPKEYQLNINQKPSYQWEFFNLN